MTSTATVRQGRLAFARHGDDAFDESIAEGLRSIGQILSEIQSVHKAITVCIDCEDRRTLIGTLRGLLETARRFGNELSKEVQE